MVPISTEAAALTAAVAACGTALDGIDLGLAVLSGEVLHPVTDLLPFSDRTWALVVAAVDSTAPPEVEGVAEAVVPLVVRGRTRAVLLARRATPFGPVEAALLHLLAQRVAAAAETGALTASMTDLLGEYMSPDVAEAVLANPESGRLGGEDRDVTVLFADLVGFTAFSEQHPPDRVVALLNRYFAEAVPAIVDNGGTVSAFVGDAIMGLFGAPLQQPEHPLLAVRAALDMRDAVSGLIVDDPDVPRMRIGINTGIATVGTIGSPSRRVYTAIGDTVNVASRIEGIAPPGSIAIGAETHAVVRAFVEVRAMPSVAVKNRETPVTVYELLGLRRDSDQLLGRTMTFNVADIPRRPAV